MCAQNLEPEVKTLIDVFVEQIRSRYLNDDLDKHKHILYNDAFLKQIVLYPSSQSLMKKLCEISGLSEAQGSAAFVKGKSLILALCGSLKGPTLRDLSRLPNAFACAPASAPPFRQEYLGLDDSDDEGEGSQSAALHHASQASEAATQELELFLTKAHGKVSYDKVLDWWNDIGKADYPNLRLVALSVYGAFPSSAESEREFSTAGKDATAARSGLRPVFLRMLSYIALNSQRLRDLTKDDELIKKIEKLDAKARRNVKLGIEAMWALDEDDEPDAEGPPSNSVSEQPGAAPASD